MSLTVTIFGASGDLTSRKLIPALFRLDVAGLLPEDARVVGVSRSAFTSEAFRAKMEPMVKAAVIGMGETWYPGAWTRFARRLHYVAGDATQADGMKALGDWLTANEGAGTSNRLYYLSVAPELYPDIVRRLGEGGYNNDEQGYRRLIIEKPFGYNLESGKQLNRILHEHFREEQIYRIDHYLGKETVQNIMILRFANIMFEPLWNYRYIDNVQITVAESVPVGKRGGYYDGSGVLRDMFQSHLLQLMTMVAMENPGRYIADRVRNEKIKVLEAIDVLTPQEACTRIAVGRYQGYLSEPGVPPTSRTPTYAAIKLEVNNWRWRGVPFYLRSGKALKSRSSEIVIQYRQPPHQLFRNKVDGEEMKANRLTLRIQPDEGIKLSFQTKAPGVEGMHFDARDLNFSYKGAFADRSLPEAYERLLLDAIQGEASLFMRSDEIEQAWAIMDPFVIATETLDCGIPEEYAVGSEGPKNADLLLAKDGHKWRPIGG